MGDESVVVVRRDRPGTATVVLNRPHRHNAWTVPLQAAYFEALQTLADDAAVRAIVVTGAGGTFCPGADTDALQTYSDTGATNPDMELIEQPEWFSTTVPKPIIAAIEGMCAGVGLAQALMCDLRIAAPSARFTTAFARRALPPMHGMTTLLVRAGGDAVANELLLTARTFTGDEAARWGLVTELAEDPLTRALDLATEMATWCAPSSMAAMKQRLNDPWMSRLRDDIASVDATLPTVLGSADFAEGIASFLERRPPTFGPTTGSPVPTEET